MAPLTVSRYHRLGGGDIDAAIVYDVLIPQLCEQNGLDPFDLNYADKKMLIEPAFLGLAESLKIGLCIEIKRLMGFGMYQGADRNGVVKTQPGVYPCKLGERTLRLASPSLTARQFEKLLEPFIEPDLLYARVTEYRMTCSVFAPLQDALDRSGLDRDQVDYCLMVGGSSLIPQVSDAVTQFFPKAKALIYADRDAVKACVSRGAAYHALALAVFGKGLVQPVCHDEVAIRATSSLVRLIPKGASLPHPVGNTFAECHELAVPETALTADCKLRVEIVAGSDERRLFSTIWTIPGPVNRGDPICLEYRYDENQVLHLRMRLRDADDTETFNTTIENPVTNVVNPHSEQVHIEELEEELRTGQVPRSEIPDRLSDLADHYAKLGQREKAVEYLKRALRGKGHPDVGMLNRLAMLYGELGDCEREEKCYREATQASSWSGSWFNLALAQRRRGLYADAVDSINRALAVEAAPPYLVLAALLAEAQGASEQRQQYLTEALRKFSPITSLNDWELGWLVTGAQMAGDQHKLAEAREEQRARMRGTAVIEGSDGQLPILTPSLRRVTQ